MTIYLGEGPCARCGTHLNGIPLNRVIRVDSDGIHWLVEPPLPRTCCESGPIRIFTEKPKDSIDFDAVLKKGEVEVC